MRLKSKWILDLTGGDLTEKQLSSYINAGVAAVKNTIKVTVKTGFLYNFLLFTKIRGRVGALFHKGAHIGYSGQGSWHLLKKIR